MDDKNVVYTHNGLFSTYKKKKDLVHCKNMDVLRGYYIKRSKPSTDRQISPAQVHSCGF